MFKKKLILSLIAICLWASSFGAQREFAIIVDQDTYLACKAEIEYYRSVLESEGLSAVVIARVWSDPVQVKDVLYKMYLSGNLEGAVFIGNVPIPMIRDAQHFTSAFKMDQELYPFMSSSVPSDRFYDDFDLKFDYLGQDTSNYLLHYYSLLPHSPQKISCDIYTGRIKATRQGEEGYKQISSYLTKLFAQKKKENKLDVITSYTGEGLLSNSLTAWKEGGDVLREQFPSAFLNKNSVKLLNFNMYPYMKDIVIDELRREEMDLMLFHEYGTPDPYRHYLTVTPQDVRAGITVEDITNIKPNAKVVIFDACYNGDFREDQFVAGEYIFGGGNTLVSFSNSVNTSQNRSSNDLIGMLALGFSVGEWAKEINNLETHIIGDPTFRFNGENRLNIDLKSKDVSYWLTILENQEQPDIKVLALHRLFNLRYEKMPQLLVNTYYSSPFYTVRLAVFNFLQFYKGDYFSDLIETSAFDPYECIRLKSVFSMGQIGSNDYIPYISSIYLNDYLDERVFFSTISCFDLMDMDKLEAEVKKQLDVNTSYPNKGTVWKEFKNRLNSRKRIYEIAGDITNKERSLEVRLSAVQMLRNYTYHRDVKDYLIVLQDSSEDVSLRIALAEALGWFTLSCERETIVKVCNELATVVSDNNKFSDALLKTAARIQVYMR